LHAPGNTQRPNATGTPKIFDAGIRTGQPYFDTSVFSIPVASIASKNDPNRLYAPFGNVARNSLINGPGYWNLDSSIFKKMKFTERFGGEIRADVFNILNDTNPGKPGYNVSTPSTSWLITRLQNSSHS